MAEDKGLIVNIVLVGSNPMPCYVQAAYLMDESRQEAAQLPVPDVHIFAHTEDTAEYMETTRKMLMDQWGLKEDDVPGLRLDSEGRQEDIQRKIEAGLNEKSSEGPIYKVILNNTGGTKAMTTYATMAVREWCREKSTPLVECYLDDASKKLNCVRLGDGEDGWGLQGYASYPEEKNLNYFVHLSVEEIGRLYGYEKCVNKNGALFVRPLGQAPADGEAREAFEAALKAAAKRIFTDEDFMKKYLKLFARLIYINHFKNVADEISAAETDFIYELPCSPKNILRLFDEEEENGWFHYDDKQGFVAAAPDGECWINLFHKMDPLSKKKKMKDKFPEYLTMYRKDWFEQYIYMAVRDAVEEMRTCAGNLPETDLAWSLEVKKESGDKGFELDIVMSVGYELKVLSLTIDNDSLMAEHKFFEAVFRGEILGGTHSQIIAVNWAENRDEIKKDLSSFSGEQYHHIEIWGKEEVSDYDKLKEQVKKLLGAEAAGGCGEEAG